MVDQLNSFAAEVTRVAREVGTEGRLGGQAQVQGVGGVWKDLTDNVNFMAANLTGQVRAIAEVTTAVASGDLSKKITIDVKGEILELKVPYLFFPFLFPFWNLDSSQFSPTIEHNQYNGGSAELFRC